MQPFLIQPNQKCFVKAGFEDTLAQGCENQSWEPKKMLLCSLAPLGVKKCIIPLLCYEVLSQKLLRKINCADEGELWH